MFWTNGFDMAREFPPFLLRTFSRSRSVTFLHHREALGDTLMLSALARGLKQWRGDTHVAVVSRRPELFLNNPNIDENRGWHLWRSGATVGAKYGAKDLAGNLHAVEIQWRSLWSELQAARFDGADAGKIPLLESLHPEIFFSEKEVGDARRFFQISQSGHHESRRRPNVLIGCGGKLKPTHNREWGMENYRLVAEALSPLADVYQISGEEALTVRGKPVPDLRNISIRQAAALFSVCDAMLVQEGGLMHVARAVNAPCVSIFGGYVLPAQTGYDQQTSFWSKPECSPCIPAMKNCYHLKCMTEITPRKVLRAITEKIRDSSGIVIPVDSLNTLSDHWSPPPFVDRALLAKELALNLKTGIPITA